MSTLLRRSAVEVRAPFGFVIAAIASLCVAAPSADAQVAFSTGFEAPAYALGPIAAQNAWSVFNPASSFNLVQSSIVKSGTQALAVTPNGTLQSGAFHSDSPVGPLVALSVDMYLGSSSTQSAWQFAGLGGPGLSPFIGGIDISATNAIQLISASFPVVGTSFTRNVWHHLDFLFNFTAQTYSFVFDGSTLSTVTPFCRDNGPCTSATPALAYGNTFFDVFASVNANDIGVIDNLSISTVSIVPEPASVALVGAGLALLMMTGRLTRRTRE